MKPQNSIFVFTKINYLLIISGILIIGIGFLLMIGYDSNTLPNGVFNENYWNEDIFSFKRIRLAPILIVCGFIIEVYAIFYKVKTKITKK